MSALVQIAIVTGALWIGSSIVMIALAKRLPPGLLRDVAEFLPACVTTARRLRGDPAVPRRAKIALLIAIVWVLSPIDLLPEFLPVTTSSPSCCSCATPHAPCPVNCCSRRGQLSLGFSNGSSRPPPWPARNLTEHVAYFAVGDSYPSSGPTTASGSRCQ